VLELGCGTGRLLGKLVAKTDVAEAIGLDIAPRMLERAARRGHRVVQASAHQLPFEQGTMDVVVCAFYTMRDLDRPLVYDEVLRVLRPGGVFLFTLRSFYPIYLQTLWWSYLRRGRLPRDWRTLDGADGVENNLRRPEDELSALERAGFDAVLRSLRLLPLVRRWWKHPGFWRGAIGARLGSDVLFFAQKPREP
jgi:SAM-dependent methyltransferase